MGSLGTLRLCTMYAKDTPAEVENVTAIDRGLRPRSSLRTAVPPADVHKLTAVVEARAAPLCSLNRKYSVATAGSNQNPEKFVRSQIQPLISPHMCISLNALIDRQAQERHTRQAAQDVHAEPRNGLGEVRGHQEGVHQGAFALV